MSPGAWSTVLVMLWLYKDLLAVLPLSPLFTCHCYLSIDCSGSLCTCTKSFSLLLQVVPGVQFLLWFPDTVLCLLHVHWLFKGTLFLHKEFQILIYRVTSSGSPCPCAWHQQSLMLHVLAALCMTTYSMHTLVSCDPWITGSFSLICWKSHLYFTCAKCVLHMLFTFRDLKSWILRSLVVRQIMHITDSDL